MFESLEQFDQSLFLWLNGLHADWLDPIFWYISASWPWFPLFAFILWYAYRKGGWRLTLTLVGSSGLAVLLSDRISVELFKEVFERYRPTHNSDIGDLVHTVIKPNGEEYRGGLYSFVSSHATNFTALTTLFILFLKSYDRRWWWLVLWAALICYSRIYLGVHYPADLVCGALLGFVIGYIIYKISARFILIKSDPS